MWVEDGGERREGERGQFCSREEGGGEGGGGSVGEQAGGGGVGGNSGVRSYR